MSPRRTFPEPELELSWTEAMQWRVHQHRLDPMVPRSKMLDVVEDLCGLHAQVHSSALLSLWNRVKGLKPDDMDEALWQQKALIKGWFMRGTLHVVTARDFWLYQAALSIQDHFDRPQRLEYLGTTDEEMEVITVAVGKALKGKVLTRAELADAVVKKTKNEANRERLMTSWGTWLGRACFKGLLISAPSEGRYVRFTNPHSWLEPEKQDPEESLLEILRRYIGTYGPSRREDFARWWVLRPTQAEKLIADIGDEVAPVSVEGTHAWMLRTELTRIKRFKPQKSVKLLPAFDPLVIGSSPQTEWLLPGDFRPRIWRPAAWVSQVILVNGRMDGIWKHERKGKRLIVRFEPFIKIPAWARKEAEAEAERLAVFLGGALELEWTA